MSKSNRQVSHQNKSGVSDSIGLLRKIFILLTVLIVFSVLLLIFQFTDMAFKVWDRLQNTPSGFLMVYGIGVMLIALLGVFLIYKIWRVGRAKPSKPVKRQVSTEEVQAQLQRAQNHGLNVDDVAQDLAATQTTVEPKSLNVAFFGQISTGKSSLIRTILPKAMIDVSVIGGSTINVERYAYTAENGLDLTLFDMPGTEQAQALPGKEEEVMRATRRMHVVAYVLDQDITASDLSAIKTLDSFGKPLLVILNKASQYDDQSLQLLCQHIRNELPEHVPLVVCDSAHERTVTVRKQDGTRHQDVRLLGGDITALLETLADLGGQKAELATKQRQALLALAHDSLQERMRVFRRERGEVLVKSYSRKAMVGGVAAVGPGTDVLIQGYLGVDMMKSLTKLYDVSVKEVDLQTLVESASTKVRSELTVMLALVGNVCKAFPGLGTVLGGASHAVAYGLVFESLGHATLTALESSTDHEMAGEVILNHFEEQLKHDVQNRATKLIKGVLESDKK